MANLNDPVGELGDVLSGESIERLAIMLMDPDADYTPGQLARIGQAMTELGGHFTSVAKASVEDRIAGGVGSGASYTEAGVTFSWRAPTKSVGVNTAVVRHEFPQKDYPELYKESSRSGYIETRVADLVAEEAAR